MSPRALACPASLKGSLSATAAAGALKEGFARRRRGRRRDADRRRRGGDGRRALLGVRAGRDRRRVRAARASRARACSRDGTRVVEAAEAIPLDPSRLDVMAASSRGLGLWIARYRDCPLVVTVGGTATMDAGAGMLEVLDAAARPDAGALRRGDDALRRAAAVRAAEGRDAGAGRGARGAVPRGSSGWRRTRSCPAPARPAGSGPRSPRSAPSSFPGADAVLDLLGFDPRALRPRRHRRGDGRRDDLGGEGAVGGRAPLRGRRVRCVVFGGRGPGRDAPRSTVELVALSGDPARARRISSSSGRGWAGSSQGRWRRVAASPSPGAAPTRCRRSPRPAGGTPTRSARRR